SFQRWRTSSRASLLASASVGPISNLIIDLASQRSSERCKGKPKYNAVLGAIASFSGPTAPLNLRFSDLPVEFRGRPVDLDAYNLALGTASAPRSIDNPYESYASAPGYADPR